jgi:hypothetical protein
MSTATRHKYTFGGIAMLKVEIAYRIKYKTMFFLVDNALKILLG